MFMAATLLMLVKLTGEQGIPLSETMFWRQAIPAIGLVGWLFARRQLGVLRTQHPWMHVRRAVLGTVAMVLVLGVARILPLAEATILGFTMPLFAVVLSMVLLGEKVGYWRGGAVVLGLLGIVVTVGFDSSRLPLLGVAVGLAAAISSALVVIQLRQMSRTEAPITMVCWFSIAGTVLLTPALAISPPHHDLRQWAALVGLGVVGLIYQLLATTALRFGAVSSVLVMDYSQFIWSTMWGWLVFAQFPSATTWIGAPLIVASGLIIARREQLLHLRSRSEAAALTPSD